MQIVVRINGKDKNKIHRSIETNSKLNLDVTAMMAFVSALTCESCNWEFIEPILTDQARCESSFSTKGFMNSLFQGFLIIIYLIN